MLLTPVSPAPGVPARPPSPVHDWTISAASLNIAKETDPGKVIAAIRNAPRLRDADLFLFQEVASDERESSVAGQVASELGYFARFASAAPGIYDQGLALVSRYPLSDVAIKRLKRCDLRFHCRDRFAIAANVQTPWFDLRVWNAHLDTRINAKERLAQLEPVIDDAMGHRGPRLIGGDFNTNDLHWVGNVAPLPGGPSHGAALRYAMRQKGFETPFGEALNTYPALRRQLDWIFVRELRALETSVEPAPFSDHKAIWVRLAVSP